MQSNYEYHVGLFFWHFVSSYYIENNNKNKKKRSFANIFVIVVCIINILI